MPDPGWRFARRRGGLVWQPAETDSAGHERGTVLLLMPAAALVLLLLGAMAVDSAVASMAQRNLVAAVGDAANDAGSVALDRSQLLGSGRATLRPDAVAESIQHVLHTDGIDDAVVERVTIRPGGEAAQVRVRRQVHLVFSPIIPGAPGTATVHATVEVTNVRQ